MKIAIEHFCATINHCIQFGEDAEVHGADLNDDAEPPEDNEGNVTANE
jgi:hypothetical protein